MNADFGPSVPPAPNALGVRRWRWLTVALALAIFLYGTGYLFWYLGTPLGRAPQLDGAENLVLAAKIASGALPHEPFYRAMLYPAILAIPLRLGVTAECLPTLAAIFGLLCHFAATLAVARLASRLWAGSGVKGATLFAAALWGFNPVALFYAADILDVIPATALALWGLVWWMQPGWRGRDAWIGGIFLGLAVAARPHFLPMVFAAPLARAWLAGRWRPYPADVLAWAGAAAPLLALGCVQWGVAGEFRILPWQGAYNFYAANRQGANGRYFAQQMFFQELAPGENPARKESEILFAQAVRKTPFSGSPERYWNQQAWLAIKQEPTAWLKLMAKKTYYFFNDFDQYNNKTYVWHKLQSPWLRWNGLGWGLLLFLAAFAFPIAWAQAGAQANTERRARLAALALLCCAYATGVIIYYASGRFRLPLAPLLCVMAAGGATLAEYADGDWAKWRWRGIIAGMIALFIAFSNFFDANDISTFIQDELLSANAAAEVGDDRQAYELAESALALDAARPDARRIAVVSYFNLTLADGKQYDTLAGWRRQMTRLRGLELRDPALALVAGVAYWKTGDPKQAEQTWADGAARFAADSTSAKALDAARFLRGESVIGNPPPDPQMLAYLKNIPAPAK